MILSSLLLASLFFCSTSQGESKVRSVNSTIIKGKYKVGDIVKCSKWKNDSYWKGEVVDILKDVIYQVQIKEVRVNGSLKLYLTPSECTGKKRLSYEDGEDYHQTKIWIHERCLDWFISFNIKWV